MFSRLFRSRPPWFFPFGLLSNGCITFSLTCEGNPKQEAVIARIWAMAANGADSLASGSRSKFLLQSVTDDEGDEGVPASEEPQASQPVSPQCALRNRDFMVRHQGGVSWQMVGVDRPDRSVFPCSNSSGAPASSLFHDDSEGGLKGVMESYFTSILAIG